MNHFRKMGLLAALMLMLTLITAGEAAAQAAYEPIPLEAEVGLPPRPEGFLPDMDGYEDGSLSVRIETMREHETNILVARVKIADPSQLRTAMATRYGGTGTALPDRLARRANVVLAINGDFFNFNSTGYLVRQGKLYRDKANESFDMLIIDENADFHILIDPTPEQAPGFEGTIVTSFNFGPALVVDGNVCEIPDYYKNKYNVFADEPRCAIGQLGELEYLLVVVDGRRKDSDGCTCAELADFMAKQGCTMAYNLDGGNSALMWFGGENYSEKTVKAERSVSDIIYFATAIDAANTEE